MTKEEIINRINEIKREIDKNNYEISQLDIYQYALKILINSSYGAISSRKNPIGDDDLANAITVSGSNSIQQVNVIAEKFIQSTRKKMIQKRIDEINKLLAA